MKGEWEDGKSLISVKTSQVHLLDENHPELQKSLDALNQKNLDAQKAFLEENREDARMMYQTNPEMMENNGWDLVLCVRTSIALPVISAVAGVCVLSAVSIHARGLTMRVRRFP